MPICTHPFRWPRSPSLLALALGLLLIACSEEPAIAGQDPAGFQTDTGNTMPGPAPSDTPSAMPGAMPTPPAADAPTGGSAGADAADDVPTDAADGDTAPPQDDPPPPDDGGDPADDTPAGPETGLFPPVTDLTAPGPYTPVTVSNTGPGGNYSLYHPEELAPDGVLNPIVGWGSGGSTNPSWYTLLPHLASHGFVVIGSNSIPGIGGEVGQGQELVAGVDWLIEENGRAGSTFEGKLDTTRIAASGYSMGSLATFTVADDPRWVTTVHISGGLMNKADIQKLHAPAAFICGETDIANPNCATDFEMVSTPVFYGVIQGADHLGVMLSPYMEIFRSATTGWLRWHLMEDRTMAPDFVGPDCTLCTDSQWVVQQNALDP